MLKENAFEKEKNAIFSLKRINHKRWADISSVGVDNLILRKEYLFLRLFRKFRQA